MNFKNCSFTWKNFCNEISLMVIIIWFERVLNPRIKMNPFNWPTEYRTMKLNYLKKNPFEKYLVFRSIIIFLMRIFGCSIILDDFEITVVTIFPGFLVFDYFILMLYTVFRYREQPFRALQATPIFGIVFPVILSNFQYYELVLIIIFCFVSYSAFLFM